MNTKTDAYSRRNTAMNIIVPKVAKTLLPKLNLDFALSGETQNDKVIKLRYLFHR